MENINIIDGTDNVYKTPDDIIKSLMTEETLIGVIPFSSGSYKFLKEKNYIKKATLSKNRVNAGYFIMVLAVITGIMAYFISKHFHNNLIFISTIVLDLAIIIIYFYTINRYYKNVNAIAITDKKIYFISIKENIPLSHHKKGFMLVFYAPFKIVFPYKHYFKRVSEFIQFSLDDNSLFLASINFEEYKYHNYFNTTLLPIDELASFKH